MNKKDSYWFRHDSSAGRGLKMRKMAHIHGHWGKGVYWDVVEVLRDQKQYAFDCDEDGLKLLCDLIGCKEENNFLLWYIDCARIGLFSEKNNKFYCPPLNENMEVWETKKNNGKKGGRPSTKKTEIKPKLNLKETEIKPNIEANRKHKRTEQYITEQDRTKEDNNNNNVFSETCLNDDFWIEAIAIKCKVRIEVVKIYLENFKIHLIAMDEEKINIKEFKSHYTNWIQKQDLSQHKTKRAGRSNQIG